MMRRPTLSLGSADDLATGSADLVIAAAFQGEEPGLDGLPAPIAAALSRLTARRGWSGLEGQRLSTEIGGDGAEVSLYGLGQRDGVGVRKLDTWLREALEVAAANRAGTVNVLLPDHPAVSAGGPGSWLGRTLVRATYRYDRYQNRPELAERRVSEVRVVAPPAAERAYAAAAPLMEAVAGAVTFCRDLANTPGNEATPDWMAERAREMAGEHGFDVSVLGPEELARRGMGGVLAVGAGSQNPPRLVRLERGGEGPVVALVGKGVTFDTGGISIKPSKDMDEMKYDKCGACTALAVARAVAELDLPLRLRVYVPLAENMPDGRSYRPGDIVRCYDGQTVEILNTDAEGRMILADALAWAAEEEPDLLVEYSTLTGSSVVALGQDAASLYTPDEALGDALLAAAERTGERLWRMPLWPEFVDAMKGNHADLRNSGGRWGGANTAAAFLSRFVRPVERWAHLDIAGSAYVGRDADEEPGATGYGVAFTVDWLRGLVG